MNNNTAKQVIVDEGSWEFLCEMCGDPANRDMHFCPTCQDHGGDWVYVNQYGEEVDPPVGEKRPRS